jgi:hypothetical protein
MNNWICDITYGNLVESFCKDITPTKEKNRKKCYLFLDLKYDIYNVPQASIIVYLKSENDFRSFKMIFMMYSSVLNII